jgi:hypothetical protein
MSEKMMTTNNNAAATSCTATKQSPEVFPNLPLTDCGNGLTLQMFRTGPNRMGVFLGGRDGYGLLHLMTSALKGLKVRACFGERLHDDQGTFFEIELDERLLTEEELFRLRDKLLACLQNFTRPEELPRDLYAWLKLAVYRDDEDLLPSVATLLADNKVSLSSLRFDRRQFSAETVRLDLSARAELPVGLDPLFLEKGLRLLLPSGNVMPLLEVSQDSPRFKPKQSLRKTQRLGAFRN